MNDKLKPLSLLNPEGYEGKNNMSLSRGALSDLGFLSCFNLRSSDLTEFLTDSPEVIEYRQMTVRDITDVPECLAALRRCVPIMSDICDVRRLSAGAEAAEDYLYGITEAELYISLIDALASSLLPLEEKLSSPAMKELCARIRYLSEDEGSKKIRERLEELSVRVRDIKSVTIGVNLDSRLAPETIGVVSVGQDRFSTPGAIEKLLRIDRRREDAGFIAPLLEVSKSFTDREREALNKALREALSSVFKNNFRAWRAVVREYVLSNADFILGLLPEIEFLRAAGDFISSLDAKGVKRAFPKVFADGREFRAVGLVNPMTALASENEMVPNDIAFDENAGIYVLTGPNRGGKSVVTCAVGQAAVMAQLGLPVACESLETSVFDNVFCHFPSGDADTVDKGRLGEECTRLYGIISKITDKSLVLLDESLSSTGSYEASCIASELLCGLSAAKCRAVFSTHLHTLASDIPAINERSEKYGGVKIDSLVAGIDSGERSFKIERRAPEGLSYASDIAKRYGLSFENIMKAVSGREE